MNTPPADDTIDPEGEQGNGAATQRSVIGPRLYLGFVVLVSAEMFSGSSAGPRLFTWWTWCVTLWVYFLHFFLFANLAVRTRRTSLRALYLWGGRAASKRWRGAGGGYATGRRSACLCGVGARGVGDCSGTRRG